MSATGSGGSPATRPVDWQRRFLIAGLAVAGLVVGYFIAVSFLPRWWSHVVGDISDGKFRWGVWWGLFFGFLFTLVPLFVARLAWRRGLTWRARGWWMLSALVLAGPNLMTLGIVTGTGGGAHAGERTLDTEAPGFRGATLSGVLVAAAVAVGIQVFLVRHGRQRKELSKLRVEDKLRKANE